MYLNIRLEQESSESKIHIFKLDKNNKTFFDLDISLT